MNNTGTVVVTDETNDLPSEVEGGTNETNAEVPDAKSTKDVTESSEQPEVDVPKEKSSLPVAEPEVEVQDNEKVDAVPIVEDKEVVNDSPVEQVDSKDKDSESPSKDKDSESPSKDKDSESPAEEAVENNPITIDIPVLEEEKIDEKISDPPIAGVKSKKKKPATDLPAIEEVKPKKKKSTSSDLPTVEVEEVKKKKKKSISKKMASPTTLCPTTCRRVCEPQTVTRIWEAIAAIRTSKQLVNTDRIARYLQKEYESTDKMVTAQLADCVEDGLIISYTAVGFKGKSAGTEQEGFKLREDLDFDKGSHDWYCFVCHKAGDVLECTDCWRVFHDGDCAGHAPTDGDSFTCEICIDMEEARRKPRVKRKTLNKLLAYTVERLRQKTRELHKLFAKKEDECYDQLVYAHCDLNLMEEKTKARRYKYFKQFQADADVIYHNVAICYGINSDIAELAKLMLLDCVYDLEEIALCKDCYYYSNAKGPDWFCQPCRPPHELVFAKLKGFSYWPAKLMKRSDTGNDVRFFGGWHQRSVLMESSCKPIDVNQKKLNMKKTTGLTKSMVELKKHQEMLAAMPEFEEEEEEEVESPSPPRPAPVKPAPVVRPAPAPVATKKRKADEAILTPTQESKSKKAKVEEKTSESLDDSSKMREVSVVLEQIDTEGMEMPEEMSDEPDSKKARVDAGGDAPTKIVTPKKFVIPKKVGTPKKIDTPTNTDTPAKTDSAKKKKITMRKLEVPKSPEDELGHGTPHKFLAALATTPVPAKKTVKKRTSLKGDVTPKLKIGSPKSKVTKGKNLLESSSMEISSSDDKYAFTDDVNFVSSSEDKIRSPRHISSMTESGTQTKKVPSQQINKLVQTDEKTNSDGGKCNCEAKFQRLLSEQRDKESKKHDHDKDKALKELTEKLHKEFESDKQAAVSRALATITREKDRARFETEEKWKETHMEEMKKLQGKHKIEVTAIKKKQWCYNCEEEAMYHCCWNTSYCSNKCQQDHWQKEHKRMCRRKR